MTKEPDLLIQKFLDNLRITNPIAYQLVDKIRLTIHNEISDLGEKMMYGGIMFSGKGADKKDFCGVFAYKAHVSVEFSRGIELNNSELLLEGKGKQRRHLKFRAEEDIETKKLAEFVKQAYNL